MLTWSSFSQVYRVSQMPLEIYPSAVFHSYSRRIIGASFFTFGICSCTRPCTRKLQNLSKADPAADLAIYKGRMSFSLDVEEALELCLIVQPQSKLCFCWWQQQIHISDKHSRKKCININDKTMLLLFQSLLYSSK